MGSNKRTCFTLFAMTSLSCFFESGHAKMDWIYKELRKEKSSQGADDPTSTSLDDVYQVPQYYRFN